MTELYYDHVGLKVGLCARQEASDGKLAVRVSETQEMGPTEFTEAFCRASYTHFGEKEGSLSLSLTRTLEELVAPRISAVEHMSLKA